jgi:hypothetical protein
MKVVISENSFENTKLMITKSVDRIGIIDTIKKFGLPIKVADKLIAPNGSKSFTPHQCREILQYYIFNKKVLPSDYEDDEVKIHLSLDSFAGTWYYTIYFDKNESEAMTGYGTMFWDDYRQLPISIDFYRNVLKEYDNEDFVFNEYMVIDERFKTIQQLVDFYNENYFSAVKYYSKKALRIARKEMEYWFEGDRSDFDI